MSHIRAFIKKISWKMAAPSILIVINSFVWYILTYAIFYSVVMELPVLDSDKLGLFVAYYIGVTITAILGSKFFPRARNKSLYLWIFMGAIATLVLTTVPNNGLLVNALLAFFLGASIGVGLPSCLSYFADSTSIEKRGFVGGLIWSIMGFSVLILAFTINMLGQWESIIALTLWRLIGGVGFLFLNRKHTTLTTAKSPSYLELLSRKEILLYLFPMIMFSLINFAEAPMLEKVFDTIFGSGFFVFMQLVEWAFIGGIAIIGGTIADIVGRKRVVIAGFVMLGIEYAALSVFSDSAAVLYLFLALDGITWGLLFSVFFTVVWGDLGENREREKYYTLGGLPYLLAGFLPILIKTFAIDIPTVAAFSFASFFLFLAVIPLMYAPETLPEKTMRSRELKSYTEKALQKAQKEAEKKQKKHSDKAETEKEEAKEEPEESPEDAEARKLAEKYY